MCYHQSMNSKKIYLASDHAGYELKAQLRDYLITQGYYNISDVGPDSLDPDDDYPDMIHPACALVDADPDAIGIFVCGSGTGVNIVANRYPHIRAVNALNPTLASLARQDEDANVLCLGAKFVSYQSAIMIFHSFVDTPFAGGRHQRRIDKINIPH